jgi:hypothetical protein
LQKQCLSKNMGHFILFFWRKASLSIFSSINVLDMTHWAYHELQLNVLIGAVFIGIITSSSCRSKKKYLLPLAISIYNIIN